MSLGARAYARTQTETASKERLMALLFEAALKHLRSGAAALEAGQRASAVQSLTRASDIVSELSATLDVARLGELGTSIKAVYHFVCTRILSACATFEPKPAREAERAFAPLAEAFTTAVGAPVTAPPPP